ncbi:MAG: glycosyltransferase family 2 protein [Pseudomonadota bacterium]
MRVSLTLFFIVEPPNYQYMACYLAASLRNNLPDDVELVGYCPDHHYSQLDKDAVETLRRLRVDLRTFKAENRFEPAYPHGNKILAALEPRGTLNSGFMDSDILMLKDTDPKDWIKRGYVSASVAASMYWAKQNIWKDLYDLFDMDVPEERVMLMRDKRFPRVPYYSSGFVVFPERATKTRPRFADIWMETAQKIDGDPRIQNKRPYLDQMSLPIAIKRAGLKWNELPEKHHYILGGSLRGEPFPKDQDIHTVHYRKWDVLKEAGLARHGYQGLIRQTGTRRVSNIFNYDATTRKPISDDIQTGRTDSDPKEVPKAAVRLGADASKAGGAAITMVYQDYVFLKRWLGYYGAQFGRENLYILNHGDDAGVRELAQGANLIPVPRPEDKSRFDNRRWAALSSYANGLTFYYNWIICGDVDELVIVHPDKKLALIEYLNAKLDLPNAPKVISPFAIEIVHTPALEADALEEDAPILALRRNFRINTNYAKPCITRRPVQFSKGGHGCNIEDVTLDPDLFLLHLRYFDDALSRARLLSRKSWIEDKNGPLEGSERSKQSWDAGVESFDNLSKRTPVAVQSEFPEIVDMMVKGRMRASTGNWFWKNYRSKDLYRLPDSFADIV